MSAQVENASQAMEAIESDVNPVEAVAQQNEAEVSSPAESASRESSDSSKGQEYNWKRARQQLEELQWENKKLKEKFQEFTQAPSPPQEDEFSEIEKLAEDEILTKAQTQKLSRRETKKLVKETLANFKKELLMESLDDRIRSKFPDYFSVATEQNLDELKRDPLFVKALKGLDNPYDQACYVYRELEKAGITSESSREQQKIQENSSKPRSAHSLGGSSPLHVASDFSAWPSKDLQSKLYQEMTDAAKGA